MKLTLQLKLVPTPEQYTALLETMHAFNAAASHAARVGFDAHVFSQAAIHVRCYRELRNRFGLSSQMAVRAIGKAVECFKRDRTTCPVFHPQGAMTYDERLMGWKGPAHVSLLTLDGRQLVAMVYGEYQAGYMERLKGQVDIVYRGGQWYLYATIELPDTTPLEPTDFLGVDLGVIHLATTSDATMHSGERVETCRTRYARRRQRLQRAAHVAQMDGKRPKNIRRALKRTARREAGFRRDVNHCISKTLVAAAEDTGRGIALEELTGIRDRARFRQPQRARMTGWAFAQLRFFVEYKAQLAGVPVVLVDPRHTSQQCSVCGHIARANRQSQAVFSCKKCGYTTNADVNAAQNIRHRARVSWPEVAGRRPQQLSLLAGAGASDKLRPSGRSI
jgi:IS605 OrfB family transposase